MEDVTAIILTMNEEKNIGECIKSIENFVSRIVVVDSGSNDKTVELARSLGAEVFLHEFENYATQFNWALDNTDITTKWALRIDADERLTEKLCKEAEQAIKEHNYDDVNGMVIRLRKFFLDKWIKHGGEYPFRKLMLFKVGIGRLENRKMDEHTILSSGKSIELKNDGLHYDFKNLNHWVNKQNWYATREMQDYYEIIAEDSIEKITDNNIKRNRKQKRLYYKLPSFIRPVLLFIYRYIFLLGFLDGLEGLIYQFHQTLWYRFLVDAKIYEHKKMRREMEKTGALKG